MKKILLSLIVSALLVSCDFSPKVPLNKVENVVVTPGGESLVLDWDKVDGATNYKVFYTNDGKTPSLSSTMAESSTTNNIEFTGLDSTKTYTFLVQALATEYAPSTSAVTDQYQPHPIITIEADFSGISANKVVIRILEVGYNPVSDSVDSNFTNKLMDISAELDTNDIAKVSFGFDREKYLGYALIIDNDESGDLTTGDTVAGSGTDGNGTYTYSYLTSHVTGSGTLHPTWANYSASHTY